PRGRRVRGAARPGRLARRPRRRLRPAHGRVGAAARRPAPLAARRPRAHDGRERRAPPPTAAPSRCARSCRPRERGRERARARADRGRRRPGARGPGGGALERPDDRGVDGEDAREAHPAEAAAARPGAGGDPRLRERARRAGRRRAHVTAPAVEVRELVKRYPRAPVNAVDGVSFEVAAGEVFGLLGPNGAGKTTTVGVLTTRARPTSGSAAIGGVDVVRDPVGARRQLAVVLQRSNLDRSISIRDNLIFHAAYHGVPARVREARADELLDQFGLLERARSNPDFFSGGESQRVMIARALMHRPRVLFLDEPTTGLDPAARLFVWDRLR